MFKKLSLIYLFTDLANISDMCASNTSSTPSSEENSIAYEFIYDAHYMRTNYYTAFTSIKVMGTSISLTTGSTSREDRDFFTLGTVM